MSVERVKNYISSSKEHRMLELYIVMTLTICQVQYEVHLLPCEPKHTNRHYTPYTTTLRNTKRMTQMSGAIVVQLPPCEHL